MRKLTITSGKLLLWALAVYGSVYALLPLVRVVVLDKREYWRIPSPGSEHELVFVQLSAGAATSGLRQIFLVELGGSARSGEKIVEVYGGNSIVATWVSPRRVQLDIAGSLVVSDLVSRVHRYDVTVETNVRYTVRAPREETTAN